MGKIQSVGQSALICAALVLSLISLPLSHSFADSNRQDKMREINAVFQSAVAKANLDAKNGLETASTPVQKSTIASTRRSAIDAAINARDASIAALGSKPVAPTESTPSPKTVAPVQPTPSLKPVAPVQPTPSLKPVVPVQPTPSPTAVASTRPTPSPTAVAPVQPTPSPTAVAPVQPTPSPKK